MVQGEKTWAAKLILKEHKKVQALVAVLLGLVQALALGYPFEGQLTSILQIAGFACFILLVHQSEESYGVSWLFASAWLFGSVAWLYIALHVHGHMPAALSIVAILILCAGLANYYSLALWLYVKLKRGIPNWTASLLLASAWTMAELARAQWLTGFPWAALGYGQVNSYFSYLAPLMGVYGIGFMSVLASIGIVHAWESRRIFFQIISVILVLGLLIPAPRDDGGSDNKMTFTLLQANIPQDLKFTSGRQEALNWYKEELLKSKSDVTVLPETAIPYFKNDLPMDYWQAIEDKFKNNEQAAIVGIPTKNSENEFGNSAIVFGASAGANQYDKYHLVPFGEFTPQALKWFTEMLDVGMTDFIRGSQEPEPVVWKGHQLSVNICYEDLFGEELARRFVSGAEKVPEVLVNISNIGWFGDNYVVDQHLNIARMRSLEFNRPTVRATNSGGTAIIDAQGKIQDSLKPYTRGVLRGEISAGLSDITPYAYWSGHWGLKPLWIWCLAIWGVAYWQYKKSQAKGKDNRPSVK